MSRGSCITGGCGAPELAKGLCSSHYGKKRYTDGLSRRTPSMTANETLRRGGALNPPRTLPYRVLAKTCPQCGDFWTTPGHLLRKDSGPLPQCRKCSRRQAAAKDAELIKAGQSRTKARRRRRQSETVEAAPNRGKEWTGPELEMIARDDLTTRELSAILGRTFYAVADKRTNLRREPLLIELAGERRRG